MKNRKFILIGLMLLTILSIGITVGCAEKSKSQLTKISENDYRYIIEVNGKYGYINKKGEEVIKPQYDYAGEFSEGLAPVCNNIENKGNQKCGYVNANGEIVIPLRYDNANSFSNERGLISLNSKYGFIDRTGKLIIKNIYEEAQNFSENLAAVKINNKWGFVDKNGIIVIKPQFDIVRSFWGELAWFGKLKQNNITSHGYINKRGLKIINFDEFFLSQDFNSGLVPKQTDNGCTYINKNSEEIINLQKLNMNAYREPEGGCAPFYNNLLAVQYGNNRKKFGYIDTTGKLKIKLDIQHKSNAKIFPSYQITSSKLIKVANSSNPNCEFTYGFVNRKGKIIVEPIYTYASEFRNGLAMIYSNGENKYINEYGKVIWSNKSNKPLIIGNENGYYPYDN